MFCSKYLYVFHTHSLSLFVCFSQSLNFTRFSASISLSLSRTRLQRIIETGFLLFHTSISMVSRARIKKVVRNVFFPPRDRFSSLFKLGGLSGKEAKNLILETHLRFKKIFLQKLCQNINEFHQTYTVVLQNWSFPEIFQTTTTTPFREIAFPPKIFQNGKFNQEERDGSRYERLQKRKMLLQDLE